LYAQCAERGVREFVKPWNPNSPNTSKSGNQLAKDFEEHMIGFCHKCGYSNHAAKDCCIYPSNTTVLTLCLVCCQGLHTECKSRRKDILLKNEMGAQKEAMTGELNAHVKKLFNVYSLNQ